MKLSKYTVLCIVLMLIGCFKVIYLKKINVNVLLTLDLAKCILKMELKNNNS